MATRDAQELGIHRDSLDPKPKDSSIESVLENQWVIQRRRRMYALLAVWDLNCAMVLGRPGTIDWNKLLPTPPVDAILPENGDKSPIVPRGEDDPPTPITRLLWNYQLCGPLRAIMNLENEGPYPVDFSKVDQVHQSILDLDKKMPPAFRLENPDTRWDDRPETLVSSESILLRPPTPVQQDGAAPAVRLQPEGEQGGGHQLQPQNARDSKVDV
jgi:hypothetical protein